MRGFIHVLEAIIIIMIMLTVLVPILSLVPSPHDFDPNKRVAIGKDVLAVLQANETNWLDDAFVRTSLATAFDQSSYQYIFTRKGTPKSLITVGCLCDDAEYTDIQNLLQPFMLNRQNITFFHTQLDKAAMTFPHGTDLIILSGDLGQPQLDGNQSAMQSYLQQGGGILQLRDLSSEAAVGAAYINLFGIEWAGDTPPAAGPLTLVASPTDRYWQLANLIEHVPVYDDQFGSSIGNPPDIFVPASSGWQQTGDGTLGVTVPGVIQVANAEISPIAKSMPVNYTAEIEFTTGSDNAFELFWAPYSVDTGMNQDYIFAGLYKYANTILFEIAINVTGQFNHIHTPITFHPIRLQNNVRYRLRMEREGSSITVIVRNETFVAQETYDLGPAFETVGLGAALGVNDGTFELDNARFFLNPGHVFGDVVPGETVLASGTNPYRAFLQSSDGRPAGIANDAAAGAGRTVWLSAVSGGVSDTDFDRIALFRGAAVWAAGDTEDLVSGSLGGTPSVIPLFDVIAHDMLQPVVLVLKIGTRF
ncbi:MAG: hypothetical protein KKA90_04000 [Nanoarchaeota archaeon]|nr:hypothetical protein [Nanoarchaeota archaeon]